MKKNIFVRSGVTIIIAILMAFSIAGCDEPTSTESTAKDTIYEQLINNVKSCTDSNTGTPLGDVFDNYFANPKWEVTDDGEGHFCKFTGECEFANVPVTCEILFTDDNENSKITADVLLVNGEKVDRIILESLLSAASDSYLENNTVDGKVYDYNTNINSSNAKDIYSDPNYYILTDKSEFNKYTNMDDFIINQYGPFIWDYEIYPYGDEYGEEVIEIYLYLNDDDCYWYDWNNDAFINISTDIREALEYYYGFYNYGWIHFITALTDPPYSTDVYYDQSQVIM